jgi:hypothetical protein
MTQLEKNSVWLTKAGRKQIERDTRQWAETFGDHDALPGGERRLGKETLP